MHCSRSTQGHSSLARLLLFTPNNSKVAEIDVLIFVRSRSIDKKIALMYNIVTASTYNTFYK